MKLGTALVKEGVITPEQLEEALKAQVIFGGKLGTNLIELGYLDAAEKAYRRSLEYEPDNELTHNELAYIAHLHAGGDKKRPRTTIAGLPQQKASPKKQWWQFWK